MVSLHNQRLQKLKKYLYKNKNVKRKSFIISSLFVNALFKWKHAHKNTFVALTKLLLEEAIDPMDKGKRLFFFTNCP